MKYYISYQMAMKYPIHFEDVYKEAGFHEDDWRTVEGEYFKIASISEAINSQLILVHIPQKGPWTESQYYPSKRLANWASKNNVEFVDILPAMVKASENKYLYYEKNGHCTTDVYQVIAETIYKYLVESKMVP